MFLVLIRCEWCSWSRLRSGGWVIAVVNQLYKLYLFRLHDRFTVYTSMYNTCKIVIFSEKEAKGTSSLYVG